MNGLQTNPEDIYSRSFASIGGSGLDRSWMKVLSNPHQKPKLTTPAMLVGGDSADTGSILLQTLSRRKFS